MHILPELAGRSMLSDGRIVPYPLRRHACGACGLAAHVESPSDEAVRETFAEGYDLYAHPPGDRFENERQRRYADWIKSLAGPVAPSSVFEVGCGNGSLLMQLRSIWPSASFAGIEPAAAAAKHAKDAGFAVTCGFLESCDHPNLAADIALSVNVLEHSADPIRFLRVLRDSIAPSGKGIIICPDGDSPSTELLIFDHLQSLTGMALARLCAAARLRVVGQAKAPAGLGAFQAAAVETNGEVGSMPETNSDLAMRLIEARSRFLFAWQRLDGRLLERAGGSAELLCFGTGECAQLLRAYAPRIWQKVVAFAIDGGAGFFDGRPVLDYSSLRPTAGRAILPAIRHDLHRAIYQRLKNDGHEFVAWNDLLPA